MNRRTFLGAAGTLAASLGLAGAGLAAAPGTPLPPPPGHGSTTLDAALKARRSQRSFAPTPLPADVLSGLLWAAFGVNRPDSGGRTAPSARNAREVDIHVATAAGLFRYDAPTHALVQEGTNDVRGLTGMQGFAAKAPADFVYVADMTRAAGGNDEEKLLMAAVSTGCICQNVSLSCAAQGLATVVRASIDIPALAKAMALPASQRIVLAQTVGYPA